MAQGPKSGKSSGSRRVGRDRQRGSRRRDAPASGSPLTAGLFSHIADREVPCRIDGCDNTWTWTGAEQMQALGKPPPERMCEEHLGNYHALEDREVACRNRQCERTWTWKRGAQLLASKREESLDPPARLCKQCYDDERNVSDREIPCRISGCSRTWTWSCEAQVKHRAWIMRGANEQPDKKPPDTKGKRRRPRLDEPPARLCKPCHDKHGRLNARESPCKVHGCTHTVTVDRDAQLQAWVALDTNDLEADGALPRRMCEGCREFCRAHPDEHIACGRPGCELTWTYKTGAQLQAFLSGRRQPPIRLCDTCAKGEFLTHGVGPGFEGDAEVMPCVVPGCDGTWRYQRGAALEPDAEHEGMPLSRMCEPCRTAHAPSLEAS